MVRECVRVCLILDCNQKEWASPYYNTSAALANFCSNLS